MFKPHYGECSKCLQQRLIVVKKMLCKKCNEDGKGRNIRRANDSKIKGSNKRGLDGARKAVLVKKTPVVRRRKPTGELDVFKSIASSIEGSVVCACCKKGIANLGPINFSHVVPKSIAPGLRLDKRNIWICCTECHHEWEFGDRNQEKFKEKNEQAEKLKQEYYGQGKTKG